jgi:hypothetical protein
VPAGLIRTFLDSGVLITAYNARPELKAPALAVLKDPGRIFLSSPFVRHEVCPKALFNKRREEYRFYREYFQRAVMFSVAIAHHCPGRPASRAKVRYNVSHKRTSRCRQPWCMFASISA